MRRTESKLNIYLQHLLALYISFTTQTMKASCKQKRGKTQNTLTMFLLHSISLCSEMTSCTSPLLRNSVVSKIEPAQKWREIRRARSLSWYTIIQFEQCCSCQLVTFRDCKCGFLLKLNPKQLLEFFRFCNMYKNVWILRRLKNLVSLSYQWPSLAGLHLDGPACLSLSILIPL